MDVLKITSALQKQGVQAVVKDEHESARLAGFGSSSQMQQIWVHSDEEKISREVIKNL